MVCFCFLIGWLLGFVFFSRLVLVLGGCVLVLVGFRWLGFGF